MRSKLLLGIASIVVLSSIILLGSFPDVLSPEEVHPGIPAYLTIPAIGLNSVIERTGLTPEGAMDVPKIDGQVAWFELGPRPGDVGSAVIDGHYGLKNGKPSVFDDLHKLKTGDKIYVKDENGASISFVVMQIRSYDPKADATDVFTSSDGKAHLNLITCEGVWNKTAESYSRRLVVFTDRE